MDMVTATATVTDMGMATNTSRHKSNRMGTVMDMVMDTNMATNMAKSRKVTAMDMVMVISMVIHRTKETATATAMPINTVVKARGINTVW